MPRITTTPRRYAEAAFEVAVRDDSVAAWQEQLDRAAEVLGAEDVARVLQNPAIPVEKRREVVEQALGADLPRPVLNMLFLMLHRGRIELLPQVAAHFRQLVNRREGITTATATSAAPLDEAEVSALRERLQQMTGGRVELELQIDPTILGGVVVRLGDRLIDGSVRGRLERLRNQLASGAIQP